MTLIGEKTLCVVQFLSFKFRFPRTFICRICVVRTLWLCMSRNFKRVSCCLFARLIDLSIAQSIWPIDFPSVRVKKLSVSLCLSVYLSVYLSVGTSAFPSVCLSVCPSESLTNDWVTDWLNYWVSDWGINWLNDWPIDWPIDWLNDWMVDFLKDCTSGDVHPSSPETSEYRLVARLLSKPFLYGLGIRTARGLGPNPRQLQESRSSP